jgi:predicted nucleic acid-binding protein
MELVVDTSVLLAVLTGEPERPKLLSLTVGADLIAPMSVHWEVGNALSAMLKRNRISLKQAQSALAAYEKIPLRHVDVSIANSIRIAAELAIYAYDAYLIECAHSRRIPLLSLDKGLHEAAKRWGVSIEEVH